VLGFYDTTVRPALDQQSEYITNPGLIGEIQFRYWTTSGWDRAKADADRIRNYATRRDEEKIKELKITEVNWLPTLCYFYFVRASSNDVVELQVKEKWTYIADLSCESTQVKRDKRLTQEYEMEYRLVRGPVNSWLVDDARVRNPRDLENDWTCVTEGRK